MGLAVQANATVWVLYMDFAVYLICVYCKLSFF